MKQGISVLAKERALGPRPKAWTKVKLFLAKRTLFKAVLYAVRSTGIKDWLNKCSLCRLNKRKEGQSLYETLAQAHVSEIEILGLFLLVNSRKGTLGPRNSLK